MMKILALVPARGGSKRLPKKNILPLGGKPLITWTIEAASVVSEICDILISTDDEEIASISRDAGGYVPWLRPTTIATDTASSTDVALHALNWYEETKGSIDGLLLLQPTSPYRTSETIRRGIELFRKYGGRPVLGVSPARDHPMWTYKLKDDLLVPFMEHHGLSKRSQDLPTAYTINGCFYLIEPNEFRAAKSFFKHKAVPLVINSPIESLDIDTKWDFELAEFAISNVR